ncbi:gfo/Idh/MocA family oxidoreductase [Arthrobacter psychrolactophilus]|uniref:Gfo/Idh/MocA family oxidoreductase n=1 Tax=Arthrobacter psychrolactophilus TaxID=92442 RepID=A0A2V5IUJ5_9MICC|nr:Gfo/Idh/MocA family oxidoreductase [Arthrobacter psychrolactophilus]PYI40179.1 gfo/Idh/MocA family oxidoreductase [Arthrobacter psychrolactophilus]
MRAPIGTAIIGTGAIAQTHAAAIECTDGLELVAVGSRSVASAQAFIDKNQSGWNAPAVRACTLEDVLRDERVQLVSVVTPTGTHIDIGTQVLAAGRHLLLEKPLDVDLARTLEFAQVAAKAEERGLVCASVSQNRFSPAVTTVRKALDAGRLGQLTSGVASVGWWRSQEYYDRAAWRGTWAQDGGGALMNQGIHTLDLLLWFLGEPVRVNASSRRLAHERIDVEDTLAAVVEFSSGALATVHATTSAYPGLATRLQIMGTTGSAVIEHDGLSYLHLANGTPVGDMGLHGTGNQVHSPNHACHRDATSSSSGHARQFADLVNAIRTGERALTTIADAASTLTTIHAIYRSATIGMAVDLAEVIASPTFDTYRVGTARVQR